VQIEGDAGAVAVAVLRPQWPAPPWVGAAVSLRDGGVSAPPFASLNLATHVGDDPVAVAENRRRLRAALALPAEPLWLAQQHGTGVVDADRLDANRLAADRSGGGPLQGDAAVTWQAGRVLAVLVADCLPVLLARRDGRAVAIAHAGWRGLAAGVLEASVTALDCPGQGLHAWLGPVIGPEHFEVGEEVRAAFCRGDARSQDAFERNARGRWQCDLHGLARQRLAALGVQSVQGERRCSYGLARSFYSYRRDGVTGRMAALIWLNPA
jgi:hypothetical protein